MELMNLPGSALRQQEGKVKRFIKQRGLATTTYSTGTSIVTPSITPSANRLYLAGVWNFIASADPHTPTMSGAGLTWVQVATAVSTSSGGLHIRCTIFRAMGVGSPGAVTADFGGETPNGGVVQISEFLGADISGTNGSGAIVQTVTAIDSTGASAATPLVTLAAFSNYWNATFGVFACAAGFTGAGSGFTVINNGGGFLNEFKNSNDTSVDATRVSADSFTGIAVELKAA